MNYVISFQHNVNKFTYDLNSVETGHLHVTFGDHIYVIIGINIVDGSVFESCLFQDKHVLKS